MCPAVLRMNTVNTLELYSVKMIGTFITENSLLLTEIRDIVMSTQHFMIRVTWA